MKTLYLIGIGNIGRRILQKVYEHGVKANFVIITDSLNTQGEKPEFKGESININISMANYEKPESLISIIRRNNSLFEKYIFIGGLGGRNGFKLLESLTLYFKKTKTEWYSIGICPFKFEGTIRRKRAIQSINNLQSFPNFKYFDNNLIAEKNDGKINLAKAFEINDNEIVNYIIYLTQKDSPEKIVYN